MASDLLHISDILSLIYSQKIMTVKSVGLEETISIISGLNCEDYSYQYTRESCIQRIRIKYELLFDNEKIYQAIEELNNILEKDNSGQSTVCLTTNWLKKQKYILDLYGENLKVV